MDINSNTPNQNYTLAAHYYRGLVINQFIGLEKDIEYYITIHLFGWQERSLDMVYIIMDRMSFETKRASLKALLDKAEEEKGFIKTKNNSYPASNLLNELRLLNDIRNYFAHYMLLPSDEGENRVIGLADFRDNLKVYWYSKTDIEKILKRIQDARNNIQSLYDKKPT